MACFSFINVSMFCVCVLIKTVGGSVSWSVCQSVCVFVCLSVCLSVMPLYSMIASNFKPQ